MKNRLKVVFVSLTAVLAVASVRAQVVGSAEVEFGTTVNYDALDSNVSGTFSYGVFGNSLPDSAGAGNYVLDVSFFGDPYVFGGFPGGDFVAGGFSGASSSYSSFTLADFGGFNTPVQFLDLLENSGADLGTMSFLYDLGESDFTYEGHDRDFWSFSKSETVIADLDETGFNVFWSGGGSAITNISLTAVPEPSTIAGIGIGVICLGFLTYRRRKALVGR